MNHYPFTFVRVPFVFMAVAENTSLPSNAVLLTKGVWEWRCNNREQHSEGREWEDQCHVESGAGRLISSCQKIKL